MVKLNKQILPYVIYPVLVGSSASLYLYLANKSGNIGDFESTSAFTLLSLGFICICILFEYLIPYNKEWNQWGKNEKNDVLHLFLAVNTGEAAAKTILLSITPSILSNLPSMGENIWPSNLPFIFQFLIGVTIYDLSYYWYHRLSHKIPLLWRMHRLHHSQQYLHTLKGFRFNTFDIALEFIILSSLLFLFGVPAEVLVWMFALMGPINFLHHSNIEVKIPKFLDWLLIHPRNHRIHHEYIDNGEHRNYAGFTLLWDVIFGTYKNSYDYQPKKLGAQHHTSNSFLGQYFDFLRKE